MVRRHILGVISGFITTISSYHRNSEPGYISHMENEVLRKKNKLDVSVDS